MLLKDKTLLVTGSGRGIGKSIVQAALSEEAGVMASWVQARVPGFLIRPPHGAVTPTSRRACQRNSC